MKLSNLKPNERKTLLVYGESGSGKTVFSCSAPGPIFVYDFDGKISSAASFYQGTEKINDIEYLNCQPQDKMGSSFKKMNDHLGGLDKTKYKTIVIDSPTSRL